MDALHHLSNNLYGQAHMNKLAGNLHERACLFLSRLMKRVKSRNGKHLSEAQALTAVSALGAERSRFQARFQFSGWLSGLHNAT